jgi:hypothetical protein
LPRDAAAGEVVDLELDLSLVADSKEPKVTLLGSSYFLAGLAATAANSIGLTCASGSRLLCRAGEVVRPGGVARRHW